MINNIGNGMIHTFIVGWCINITIVPKSFDYLRQTNTFLLIRVVGIPI